MLKGLITKSFLSILKSLPCPECTLLTHSLFLKNYDKNHEISKKLVIR